MIANEGGDPINHLAEGVKLVLEEVVNKNSPTLGRNADYLKVSKVNKLPPYLIVQMMRFQWKKSQRKYWLKGH